MTSRLFRETHFRDRMVVFPPQNDYFVLERTPQIAVITPWSTPPLGSESALKMTIKLFREIHLRDRMVLLLQKNDYFVLEWTPQITVITPLSIPSWEANLR